MRRFSDLSGCRIGLYVVVALSIPTNTAICSVVSSAGLVLKYDLAAVFMPNELLPKSTVLAYIVSISFLSNSSSSFVAIIHSLLFMIRILMPGIFPSNPVEYSVRTRNRFFANCWVIVEAPRASL